jgi:hypothetical protein
MPKSISLPILNYLFEQFYFPGVKIFAGLFTFHMTFVGTKSTASGSGPGLAAETCWLNPYSAEGIVVFLAQPYLRTTSCANDVSTLVNEYVHLLRVRRTFLADGTLLRRGRQRHP